MSRDRLGRLALRGALTGLVAAAAAIALLAFRGEERSRTPSPPSSPGSPRGDDGPQAVTRLSDERRSSRWAYVKRSVRARTRPHAGARPLTTLTTRTPDRTPEVVLALAETSERGAWVLIRLPMRPNGSVGWVPRAALGRYHIVTTALEIDLARRRLALLRHGEPVWSAPAGIGTRANPTPRGRFYVRSRIVPLRPEETYGVFAFGTSGFSPRLSDWPGGGVVGIHGTDRPGSIPGRVSHGCVRLRNADIAFLRDRVSLGTPVHVR